ncbi:hypothetical protein V2W45_1346879, partial [Cenococcum geophilum]
MGKKRVNPNAGDLPPAKRVQPVRSTRKPPTNPNSDSAAADRVLQLYQLQRELNSFTFNTADCEDVPRPVGWLPASKWPPHSADALLKANIKDGPCVG